MKIRQALVTMGLRLGAEKGVILMDVRPTDNMVYDEAFASFDAGLISLHIRHPDAAQNLRVGQRWRVVLEPIEGGD